MQLETRHCALCGPTAKKRVKFPPRFSQSELTADIFSDPTLPENELSRIYSETRLNYDALESQIYDSYVPILDRAVGKLVQKRTFVEVGGGSGFMLRYGVERGFAVQTEIEPSRAAEARFCAPSLASRFLRRMFSRSLFSESSVDLVCFFQMLDHIYDPKSFLEDVFHVQAPGGVSIAIVHDTNALPTKMLRERSPIYGLWHTYLFNQQNIRCLFEAVGFTCVEVFPIPNDYALWYWLHALPLPDLIKRGTESALAKLRLSNRRLRLYAGNLAVIAQKSNE